MCAVKLDLGCYLWITWLISAPSVSYLFWFSNLNWSANIQLWWLTGLCPQNIIPPTKYQNLMKILFKFHVQQKSYKCTLWNCKFNQNLFKSLLPNSFQTLYLFVDTIYQPRKCFCLQIAELIGVIYHIITSCIIDKYEASKCNKRYQHSWLSCQGRWCFRMMITIHSLSA